MGTPIDQKNRSLTGFGFFLPDHIKAIDPSATPSPI